MTNKNSFYQSRPVTVTNSTAFLTNNPSGSQKVVMTTSEASEHGAETIGNMRYQKEVAPMAEISE